MRRVVLQTSQGRTQTIIARILVYKKYDQWSIDNKKIIYLMKTTILYLDKIKDNYLNKKMI